MTQKQPKHVKGDGISAPDLKIVAGAYLTITYWQADPQNERQQTVYIQNERKPEVPPLALHPNEVTRLAEVLSFLDEQLK